MDACVLFQTICNMGPLRGYSSTSSTAADVLKVTNFTQSEKLHRTKCVEISAFILILHRHQWHFSLIHHVGKLELPEAPSSKCKDLIRMYQGEADETRPQVNKCMSPLFPTRCPLVLSTAVSSHAVLLNYTDKPERLIRGSINCPFSFQTWHRLISAMLNIFLLWVLSQQKQMTSAIKSYHFQLKPQ